MLNLIIMLCQLELKFVHSKKKLLKVRLKTVQINYLRSSYEFRRKHLLKLYLDPFEV